MARIIDRLAKGESAAASGVFGSAFAVLCAAARERLGRPMLVVTRGADGATLMSTQRRVDIPIAPPSSIVDPTGVGDAFRAGLIVGLLRAYPWEVTGRLAALAATYVLENAGTMNHHYTLEEFVARYRSVFGDTPELEDLQRQRQGNPPGRRPAARPTAFIVIAENTRTITVSYTHLTLPTIYSV